jgi:hypothetical protein
MNHIPLDIISTRFVVQSIGVAVLATVLASALSPQVKQLQNQFQEGASQQAAVTQSFGLCETPGVSADQNVPPGVPSVARAQAKQAIDQACVEYLSGFDRAYKLTFYVALAAIAIGLFMPGWPRAWAGRTAAGEAPAPAGH